MPLGTRPEPVQLRTGARSRRPRRDARSTIAAAVILLAGLVPSASPVLAGDPGIPPAVDPGIPPAVDPGTPTFKGDANPVPVPLPKLSRHSVGGLVFRPDQQLMEATRRCAR